MATGRRYPNLFSFALLAAGACGVGSSKGSPEAPAQAKATAAGATETKVSGQRSAHGNGFGNTGFIWIAPVVPTTPTGFMTLDQTASGTLTVKVDRLLS